MIEYSEKPEQQYIEFSIEGKITKKDFEDLAKKIEPRLSEWKNIRLLEHVKSFEGMEPAALWADLKLGVRILGDLKHVTRCAVVADQKWMKYGVKVADLVLPGEVRLFSSAHISEARDWLLG
jgi:hypothetical protein